MSIFGKPFLTGVGKGSASGAVASFTDGAKGLPLKSLLVNIEPVQDLHGYDNPWPAGGGKNKFDGDSSKTLASPGFIVGGGTLAASYQINLPAAEYKVIYNFTASTTSECRFFKSDGTYFTTGGVNVTSGQNVITINCTEDIVGIGIYVNAAGTSSDLMICLSSVTDYSYSPYSNICPISGWSAVNVWRTGRNLFNGSSMADAGSGAKYITLNLAPNTEYTMSTDDPCKNGSTITDLFFCRMDESVSSITNGVKLGKTVTRTSDADGHLRVGYRCYEDWITPTQLMAYNTQVELGSTATPYEPYSGNEYTIQLGDTYYGGTLDVTNGVLTVDREMVAKTTTASGGTVTGNYRRFSYNLKYEPRGKGVPGTSSNTACNCAKWLVNYIYDSAHYYVDNAGTYAHVFVPNDGNSHDIQILYTLATPITIPLTPQEISTLQGANNLWADTGDSTVEYPKKSLMQIGSIIRPPHYGCVWDQENAQMRRTGLARAITTNTQNFKHSGSVNPNYDNPFDSIYPWSERKLCNISLTLYQALQPGDNIKDCVTYWETDDGFSYNDPDGVWVYTPEFWGTSYWIGSQRYFEVSPVELAGYHHYEEQITARWRGTSETRTIDGTNKTILLSKPGLPITNTALSTIHTYAKNCGMTLDSVYTLDASLLLYLVEYANYNAQNVIGNGVSDLYDQTTLHPDAAVTAGTTVQFTGLTSAQLANFIVGAIVDFGTASGGAQTAKTYITAVETASGVTTVTLADAVTITTDTFVSIHGRINIQDAEIGSMSGYIGTNSKSDAYYRGEALWGNMFFYTLGAYKSGTEYVWLAAEGTEDNYDEINTSVHTDTGIILSSTGGYIKVLEWPDKLKTLSACALCTEIGGSSSNPVGDYFYTTTGSSRVLIVGGYAYDGTHAGPFYWRWDCAASNSRWSCAGRPRLKIP